MKSVKVLLACLVAILVFSTLVYAEVPKMINYQGKITTPVGALISDTVSMVFSIYADSTGGTALWTETQSSVKVEFGVFSVLLGSVNPIPATVFDGSTRYLGLKVGNDSEMTPRKAIVSVGYAYHSGTADTATYSYTTIPPDNSVSQAKLKTATGEVSNTGRITHTLPGGTYGFYPQVKGTNGWGWVGILSGPTVDVNFPPSYTTTVTIEAGSGIGYVQQRYVTSSGKDHWIFFLLDKETKQVIGGWQAPDHPCHGQGGDENDIPHPFVSYDPAKHEVILIDNNILPELRSKVTSKRSLLTVINEEYEVDFNSHPVYNPREIIEIDEYGDKKGEIIKKIQTPEWAKILIGRDEIYLKRRLVETLPTCISYKKLKPKSEVFAETSIQNRR